tara:strand:+ start:1017 stop:1547 length:531 start_codon:yes stop_codon:yes gene_type:complete
MAKKILKEAVVRRFQKLANMRPINEMYNMHEEEEEEVGAEAEADMPPADDMGADDMGMDDDAMDGGQELELTQDELQAIAAALPALQTLASAAEGAGEEADIDDMEDMDDMPADEMGGEEVEPDVDADAIMEALRGINYTPSRNEVVNEVAKRVAKRLKTAKLHEAKLNKALGRRK